MGQTKYPICRPINQVDNQKNKIWQKSHVKRAVLNVMTLTSKDPPIAIARDRAVTTTFFALGDTRHVIL